MSKKQTVEPPKGVRLEILKVLVWAQSGLRARTIADRLSAAHLNSRQVAGRLSRLSPQFVVHISCPAGDYWCLTNEGRRVARANCPLKIRDGYQQWIADPKRAGSGERDFGCWWGLSAKQPPWWRVSWIERAGELYATELSSDRFVVLGIYLGFYDVEDVMAGWANDPKRMILTLWFPQIELAVARAEVAEAI